MAKKSIVTDDMTHCIISGSPDVAIHHLIFGTSGRAKADEDGLIVPLNPTYHNMDSLQSVHLNPVIASWSRICGQLAWEKHAVAGGMTECDARKAFRDRYGKSFL